MLRRFGQYLVKIKGSGAGKSLRVTAEYEDRGGKENKYGLENEENYESGG